MDRVHFLPPSDDVLSRKPMVVRFMQHCVELRGEDWWDGGIAAFCAASDQDVIGEVLATGLCNLKSNLEVEVLVPRYRAFVVDVDIQLRRRGRCRECPEPAGLAGGWLDIESQCFG